ncbi:ankyrin repeat domain-containing protein [Candidatus Tisiphia endosymbiont of Nemotelus uliginosus]|uniref:ankyrin repeat domain-containing protein n=1 Tax=Candidatus Tisiphia endosymbiont of Nemotelus uliginosus TaxID=3077926 RepID=UPI0035C8A57E
MKKLEELQAALIEAMNNQNIAVMSGKIGEIEKVTRLEEEQFDFNAVRAKGGMTPLHFVAQHGTVDLVRQLCGMGAKIDTLDSARNNAVHYAAKNPKPGVIKCVIEEYEADFEIPNNDGLSPMLVAASCGTTDIIKYLAQEKHCNVLAKDKSSNTIVHLAAANTQDPEAVKFALLVAPTFEMKDPKTGKIISVDSRKMQNNEELTPFMMAVRDGSKENAEYLYPSPKNDRDKNKEADYLESLAVQNSNIAVLKWAIEERLAYPHCTYEEKLTLVHMAVLSQNIEGLKYLVLEQKCDVTKLDVQGNSALHIAAQKSSVEVIKFLIDQGADPHAANNKAQTPLHIAASAGNNPVVQYLVQQHPGDVGKLDQDGNIPLHLAAANSKDSTAVKILLPFMLQQQEEQDVEITDPDLEKEIDKALTPHDPEEVTATNLEQEIDKGQTPRYKIVKTYYKIVTTYPNLELKNHKGQTPLLVATRKGVKESVECLWPFTDHTVQDGENHGVGYCAAQNPNVKVMEFVIEDREIEVTGPLPKNSVEISLLQVASLHGNKPVVELLMKNKAQVGYQDKEGRTALHGAVVSNNVPLIDSLLINGKEAVNTANYAHLPKDQILESYQVEITRRNGKEYNSGYTVIEDVTPLGIAASTGSAEAIKCLLKYDADYKKPDAQGRSPLARAIDTQVLDHKRILALLQDIPKSDIVWATNEIFTTLQSKIDYMLSPKGQLEKLQLIVNGELSTINESSTALQLKIDNDLSTTKVSLTALQFSPDDLPAMQVQLAELQSKVVELSAMQAQLAELQSKEGELLAVQAQLAELQSKEGELLAVQAQLQKLEPTINSRFKLPANKIPEEFFKIVSPDQKWGKNSGKVIQPEIGEIMKGVIRSVTLSDLDADMLNAMEKIWKTVIEKRPTLEQMGKHETIEKILYEDIIGKALISKIIQEFKVANESKIIQPKRNTDKKSRQNDKNH